MPEAMVKAFVSGRFDGVPVDSVSVVGHVVGLPIETIGFWLAQTLRAASQPDGAWHVSLGGGDRCCAIDWPARNGNWAYTSIEMVSLLRLVCPIPLLSLWVSRR